MTDAHVETDTLDQSALSERPAPRLDMWLNAALIALLVAVLAGGALFGWTIYRDKQLENATSAAGRIAAALSDQIRKNPNDAVLRVRLGEAYSAMNKFPQAIEQFNAALKIDPKHTGAYFDLGVVATTTGHDDQARIYFQKVLDLTDSSQYQNIDQTRESSYYNLGLISMRSKQYSEAAGFFKAALQIRKDASDTYYQLAHALDALGDTDSAIQQLELGGQFDPNFAQLHFYLAQLYQKKGDLIHASAEFATAAKLAPSAEPPQQALREFGTSAEWLAKAKQHLAAGNADAALSDALIACNLDATNFDAAKLYGDLLTKRGDLANALKVYGLALKLRPSDAAVQTDIAQVTAKLQASKTKTKPKPKSKKK